MVEASRSIGPDQVMVLNEKEIAKRRKAYEKTVRRLSLNQRSSLFEIESGFMEPDVYMQFRKDPIKRDGLNSRLETIGLGPRQREIVFRYFNLPFVSH